MLRMTTTHQAMSSNTFRMSPACVTKRLRKLSVFMASVFALSCCVRSRPCSESCQWRGVFLMNSSASARSPRMKLNMKAGSTFPHSPISFAASFTLSKAMVILLKPKASRMEAPFSSACSMSVQSCLASLLDGRMSLLRYSSNRLCRNCRRSPGVNVFSFIMISF